MENATQNLLIKLNSAGVVRAVDVIGQPGGWMLIFKIGASEIQLTTATAKARIFSNLTTVIAFLDKLGIKKFTVDTTLFRDDVKRFKRPDRKKAIGG